MQFIYRLHPNRGAMLSEGPTPEEQSAIQGHIAYLSKLAKSNQVLLAGRTQVADAGSFGLVVFVAESETAALEIMRQDPAVSQNVMHAELFPFRVAILADDIEAMEIRP